MITSLATLILLVAVLQYTWAIGTPPGFASGTTGGGNARAQVPANINELKSWLADSTPRVILLDKTYDFTSSEGRVTEQGCRPASNKCPNKGGQDAINGANWCNGQPPVSVTYNKAAIQGLQVNSHKTILGKGNKGVLKGKGLRIANAYNVIIQNIHITDLNPQYIWGGDAITLVNSDQVWIDHNKISLIGRQMIVTGMQKAGRVTISNNEFDGRTSWSSSCNGHHYWALYFTGQSDSITFVNNYIHHTSGRGPKVGGDSGSNVVLHAVNNYYQEVAGHALESGNGGNTLFEGNYLENVVKAQEPKKGGQVFASTSDNSACQASFGRNCRANKLVGKNSGLSGGDTGFLVNFKNKNPVGALSADQTKDHVLRNYGIGRFNN